MSDDALTMTELEEVVETPTEETRLRRVIPYDAGKVIIRAMKLLIREGIGTLAICAQCQSAKKPEVAQWGRQESDGNYVLQCGCSRWVLEGVTKI